jgi:hypothetical protein
MLCQIWNARNLIGKRTGARRMDVNGRIIKRHALKDGINKAPAGITH